MLFLYFLSCILFFCSSSVGSVCLCFGLFVDVVLSADAITIQFSLVLCAISISVLLWAFYYLDTETSFIRFIHLVFTFLFSIFLLVFSSNLLLAFVGWDLLGFTSFFLVSYFGNRRSHAASLFTALSNRFGDCFFFILLGLSFFSSSGSYYLAGVCLLLVGMTKSAQLPFSRWLPAAIFAPTPVSALVHSSTLVTAGLFLLLRFSFSLDWFKLSIGVLTSVLAGVAACLEADTKKIIALSTLSQLGIIMTGLGLCLRNLCFVHLLTHAIVKALLFISLGVIIHSRIGSQEFRQPVFLASSSVFTLIVFSIGTLRLGGVAFSACFYTKDALLESGYRSSLGVFVLFRFYLSLGLTIAYLSRVLFSLVTPKAGSFVLLQCVSTSLCLVLPILFLLLCLFFFTVSHSGSGILLISAICITDKATLYWFVLLGLLAGWGLSRCQVSVSSTMTQLGQLSSLLTRANVHFNMLAQTEAGGLQALGIRMSLGALRCLVGFGNLNLLKLVALACIVLLV